MALELHSRAEVRMSDTSTPAVNRCSLRLAADVGDYVRAPVGRYFAGEGFLHCFFDHQLCGTVFWSQPGEQAIAELTCAMNAELPQYSGMHAALVDARRLTGIDPAAFHLLSRYAGERAEVFGSNVTRQVIVRPCGVVGAAVAGFYDVTRNVNPERRRIYDEVEGAFAWLGREDGPCIADTLETIVAEVRGVSPVLKELREYLADHHGRVSVQMAANELRISTRTLQHKLAQAGTTFRAEVIAARVEAGKRMLTASDMKLTAVALDVGCPSLQHFSTIFRKLTGESPSAWRARRRSVALGTDTAVLHSKHPAASDSAHGDA
jgi:AraC-like DNA-binding protein